MQGKQYLKQRYAAILYASGVILLVAALIILSPLVLLAIYPEEFKNAPAFILPSGSLCLIGALLQRRLRSSASVTLSIQEGGIIVVICWVLVMLFSAWPFVSILNMPFSSAFFESVSGWTTTGLSVVDVTTADRMVLFFRSVIQLAGGAGLAIIMMSAIMGPTGVGISSAEGRSDQLAPHVRESARLVLIIYSCYAVAGTLAYRVAGMSLFDAVNHAFCVVSTGGFSTRPDSIGYWNSVPVEAVTLPLMLLGNLSFVTAWFLWRGRFRNVAQNGEVRLLSVIIPLAIAACFFLCCQQIYPQLEKSVRVAIFETVTAITTTGYSTVSYDNWNAFGMLLLIVLMVIGGGTCSTAGGIKQFRVYLLWKILWWEIKRHRIPRNAVQERPIWEGNRRIFVDDARIRQVMAFIFLYLATYLLGVMILCASGFNLVDALFEFASALGTVGLSVGVTSYQMPGAALWSETIAMFLGRLEFIVVIVSLLKIGEDGRRMVGRTPREK